VRWVSRVLRVPLVLWCFVVRLVRRVRTVSGILQVGALAGAASAAAAAAARLRLRERRARFHFFPVRDGFRRVAENFEPRHRIMK
jgi:hypothetical protein